jgi:hypothetical protein
MDVRNDDGFDLVDAILFNESWVLGLAFLDQIILLQQFLERDIAALEKMVNDRGILMTEAPVHR